MSWCLQWYVFKKSSSAFMVVVCSLGDVGHTPSNLRPGNPTPGHAQGSGSPSSVRPKNPTPAHATKTVPDRPGNPTPKEAAANGMEYESPNTHPSIPELPEEGE